MVTRKLDLVSGSPRLLLAVVCGVFVGNLAGGPAAQAAPLSIPAQVTLNGASVNIGTLSASVANPNSESGTFTLDPQFRNVMSDANGAQFRFFQVITYDDEPVKWNGNIIVAAGTANNTKDVVDVPAGGWDYERSPTTSGGDNSPFYENDTTKDPSNNLPYYYPGYVTEHSADGVNPGTSVTGDGPGLNNANHQTLFTTFLAYENPTMIAQKSVDIIGGYTWGIQTNGANVTTAIAPTYISYASIDTNLTDALDDALGRSGFAGWDTISNDAILTTLAPEPSSLALGALAALLGGAMAWRRGWNRRAA